MALPSTPRLYRIPKKKFCLLRKKNRSLTYKTTDQGSPLPQQDQKQGGLPETWEPLKHLTDECTKE